MRCESADITWEDGFSMLTADCRRLEGEDPTHGDPRILGDGVPDAWRAHLGPAKCTECASTDPEIRCMTYLRVHVMSRKTNMERPGVFFAASEFENASGTEDAPDISRARTMIVAPLGGGTRS
jgi:hypothetical protein